MQRYSTSMAQIQEQMLVNEYMDSVLALDEDQFIEYYDSLTREQQEELNEFIGKIARGIGKIAVAPITLPYKVGKAAVKGVGKAVTSNPAKKAAGLVGKGAAALAKGAGKAAKAAVVNKQGNVRFSTSGRADAAKKKADAIQKRNDERERLAKEKERIAKERERAKKLKGDQGTDARADVAKQQRALDDKEKETAQKSKAEIDKEKKESFGEAVDSQDTGGAAEVDMIMNQVNQMRHFLDGIEKMVSDDGDVEEWVQGKITKATDYLKTAYSYKTGEKNESVEDLEEFKKMVVTIKDPSKRRKAMDDIKRFGKRTGFRIDKMRDGKSFKIDGKGADLNKFATDLKNYYGAEIKAESYEPLEEFTSKQIARLKKEYEPLRGKSSGIAPEKFAKLRKMMDRFQKPNLLALAKADIPILSSAAKAKLVIKFGMKWQQLPEDFIPYIEIFADDNKELSEQKKGKFASVDPKVIDRIEKMMRGSRAEKDSIANMLNYLMPPEVVDMVRYKLKIVPKRGKIKF